MTKYQEKILKVTRLLIFRFKFYHHDLAHNLKLIDIMFKRLLQTRGPYKITSNIFKKTKKHCVISISKRNKLYRNRIKPIDIDVSVCML